jgi:hypothetical protein
MGIKVACRRGVLHDAQADVISGHHYSSLTKCLVCKRWPRDSEIVGGRDGALLSCQYNLVVLDR